ncbi:hypothetical protein ADUPG1_009046 [Aduncisulcus paluster]|uniref:Thioredoxin domain-containing protein n=1 Tax=Aduncisulcus paluster TaxID=2918883 RepID=A0ABQ5KVD3_9EUKA|nr:hypothetical protein ADUPG1_009046 [Aduncisulcus paluster]
MATEIETISCDDINSISSNFILIILGQDEQSQKALSVFENTIYGHDLPLVFMECILDNPEESELVAPQVIIHIDEDINEELPGLPVVESIFPNLFGEIVYWYNPAIFQFENEYDMYNHSLLEEKPLFVKFYASWCGHCKALAPVFQAASLAISDTLFYEVECSNPDLREYCSVMDIRGYPTMMYFDGAVWSKYLGPRSITAIGSFLGEHRADFVSNFNIDAYIGTYVTVLEPIETNIPRITISELHRLEDGDIVIFGDIFDEYTQKVYQLVEDFMYTLWKIVGEDNVEEGAILEEDEPDDKGQWILDIEIVRVEKQDEENMYFFEKYSDDFLPIIIQIDGDQVFEYSGNSLNFESWCDFIGVVLEKDL